MSEPGDSVCSRVFDGSDFFGCDLGAAVQVKCLQRADEEFMDRVNMYSSFYVATRL